MIVYEVLRGIICKSKCVFLLGDSWLLLVFHWSTWNLVILFGCPRGLPCGYICPFLCGCGLMAHPKKIRLLVYSIPPFFVMHELFVRVLLRLKNLLIF